MWQPSALLGHLEITVMDILWSRGESNVHDVIESIGRRLAYTTVMTTLDRLYKKGLLERRKSQRAYFYSPRLSREKWEQELAADAVAGFLAGPQAPAEVLMSCFVDAVGQHDKALLDELERKIREKRDQLNRRTAQ